MRDGSEGISEALQHYETQRQKILRRVAAVPEAERDALAPGLGREVRGLWSGIHSAVQRAQRLLDGVAPPPALAAKDSAWRSGLGELNADLTEMLRRMDGEDAQGAKALQDRVLTLAQSMGERYAAGF